MTEMEKNTDTFINFQLYTNFKMHRLPFSMTKFLFCFLSVVCITLGLECEKVSICFFIQYGNSTISLSGLGIHANKVDLRFPFTPRCEITYLSSVQKIEKIGFKLTDRIFKHFEELMMHGMWPLKSLSFLGGYT